MVLPVRAFSVLFSGILTIISNSYSALAPGSPVILIVLLPSQPSCSSPLIFSESTVAVISLKITFRAALLDVPCRVTCCPVAGTFSILSLVIVICSAFPVCSTVVESEPPLTAFPVIVPVLFTLPVKDCAVTCTVSFPVPELLLKLIHVGFAIFFF